MALVWVPPEMKDTSASGQAQAAQIFSFALAVAGHLLEVGLGQLLEDGRMRALAVIIFKIQHIRSTPFLQRMTLLCTPARSLSIPGAENSHPLLYL